MVSQKELGQRFRSGKTGAASNLQVKESSDGGTIVVGYSHAVYAHRDPSGEITAFRGWYDSDGPRKNSGTPSTQHQYRKLGILSNADETLEGAPKESEFDPVRDTQTADATEVAPII